jgi:hypothetical protein
MIRAYKYLFYTLFRFFRRFWPTDMPALKAFFLMLLVTWYTLLVLVMIAECALRVRLLPHFAKWQVGIVMAGLALPLYFLFLHQGAAKRIAAQFEDESPAKARLHGAFALSYCVISYALLIVMAVIRAKILPRQ